MTEPTPLSADLLRLSQRALDEHRADIRREVALTGEPAAGGAGCWCHDLARALDAARATVPAGPEEYASVCAVCGGDPDASDHRAARPVPAADDRERVTCVCGVSVLPENADNHLLRQDGKAHRFPAADADRERLREAVRVMLRDFDRDPTPEYLTSAVDYLLRAGVSPSTGDAEQRVKAYVDDVGGPEGVTAEGLRAALTGDDR